MKKLYILLFTLLTVSFSFTQGLEDFTNSNATASYATNSFAGNNGITWSYVASRNGNGDANNSGINLPALMLRRVSDLSAVSSSSIPGGIGDFSVKLYKGFTGGGDRQVELFVNGISRGTSIVFDDFTEHTFTVTGINEPGNVTIELKNTTSKQIIVDDISWTGYTGSATPTLSVSSPSDNSTFPSGTTSVNIEFVTANTNPGDQVNISDNQGNFSLNASSPFSVSTTDGTSYAVLVELVDSGTNVLDSETINFEVLSPCELQIGTISTTCVAETPGIDTYNVSIEFTGGGTSQYTIDTENNGTIGGNNPSSEPSGTITILGVTEGVDFTATFTGDPGNSSCDITRNITSPVCVTVTCGAPGDIIINEIMKDPDFVVDASGEYFEVYNTTESSIDMIGWQVYDISNPTETFTIASSVVVPANGYAVLGNNSVFTSNGGVNVDYEYPSNFYLGNSADELRIECLGVVLDEVSWDSGTLFPDPTGASMEFSSSFMARLNNPDNDNGANWGVATSQISVGGDLGSPGAANDFTLSSSQFDIDSFKVYPNPTNTGFVNITSVNSEVINAKVFDILGKQVMKGKVENNLLDVSNLNAGMYILKLSQSNASVTKKLVIQ